RKVPTPALQLPGGINLEVSCQEIMSESFILCCPGVSHMVRRDIQQGRHSLVVNAGLKPIRSAAPFSNSGPRSRVRMSSNESDLLSYRRNSNRGVGCPLRTCPLSGSNRI